MTDPIDIAEDVTSHRPVNIATISAGFEKGDFLVREEQGNRVYFDFFEESFNYIANKGYARMEKEQEKQWMELMSVIHDSVKGGMKYNTGTLLMVLSKPVGPEVAKDATKEKASKVRAASVKQEGKNP
mmetsp:Transcript_22736/g.31755  ORF Transcript_22736/g.31755 Transcript_22736/m.31755 type:complete len:128 (+) Transcript_22736:135-518(+)